MGSAGGEEDKTLADPYRDGEGPHSARASLLVYHREGLQVVPLESTSPVVVGRDAPADVLLRSKHLSRRHAEFTLRGGTVWVEDLGSTNGTLLNGRRIREPVPVGPDDEVIIGSVSLTVHHVGASRVDGVEGHERFVQAVEHELERSSTFERGFAMMLARRVTPLGTVRPSGLGHWAPRVRDHLRLVDRLGIYGSDTVEALLPESNLARAMRLAEQLHALDPHLRFGLAAYPRDGATFAVLSEGLHRALASTTPDSPIAVADRRGGATEGSDGVRPLVHDGAMIEIYDVAGRVSASMVPILLLGETGTGKEVLARRLHEASGRSGPLRVLNCGAIPAQLVESALFGHERGAFTSADRRAIGVFEEATGGTVLLDEIGELPIAAQVALLRVLETRTITRIGSHHEIPVDVRVLAATHRDLEHMCARGQFRLDLLYRLNTVILRIPPLRERVAEIGPLARRFLEAAKLAPESAHIEGFDARALALLERYPWPGNVRELRNAVERAVVIADGDAISEEDLPERVRHFAPGAAMPQPPGDQPSAHVRPLSPRVDGLDGIDLKGCVAAHEAQWIRAALVSSRGNRTLAAELLGLPRRTLQYKMRSYGIDGFTEGIAPLAPATDGEGRPLDFAGRVAELERQLLTEALGRAGGDPGAAAALLRIQRRTLQGKLEKLGRGSS